MFLSGSAPGAFLIHISQLKEVLITCLEWDGGWSDLKWEIIQPDNQLDQEIVFDVRLEGELEKKDEQ